jgi:hypothetical protein
MTSASFSTCTSQFVLNNYRIDKFVQPHIEVDSSVAQLLKCVLAYNPTTTTLYPALPLCVIPRFPHFLSEGILCGDHSVPLARVLKHGSRTS